MTNDADGRPGRATRRRILRTAMELFAAQGYQRTSLREIAERVGLSKAAVLYHFPAKDQILGALSEPLLDDMVVALDRAAAVESPAQRRWACIEGLLDCYLANRAMLLLLRQDLSILSRSPELYERFFLVFTRAYQMIAGPGADMPALVRASQVMSVLGDPLFTFPEVPNEVLRGVVLDGARALLTGSPTTHPADQADPAGRDGGARVPPARSPAAASRRRAGRPRALDGERLAAARRMYAAGVHTVDEIAAAVGVSRATLYRHLRPSTNSDTEF